MLRTPMEKNETQVSAIRLCLFLFLSAFTFPYAEGEAAESEYTEQQTYELEKVVVSATRMETPRENISANVTVVTRKDMETLPASNVAEVLQYVSGVYMEFNGGPGSFSGGARIQGSETRQVAIYKDGIPLNQLAYPLTDLSYLPLDDIERIEVYKGAASSAWGSALGGVINIVTKDPDSKKPFSADLRSSYGEFNTFKSSGSFSGAIDHFGYLLSVTHEDSNGFMEYSEFEQNAVYAKLHYDTGNASRISFISFFDKGTNAEPVINYPEFWDDKDQERAYQKLQFETKLGDDWALTLQGHHHRYETFIEDVFIDHREIYNDYDDEIWGGSGILTWRRDPGHIVNVGFDGNTGTYDWQNYDRTFDTGTWALYVNDTVRWGDFSINTGLRYDDDRTFGGALSPVLGLGYHFWRDKALIRFQAARGFSAPPASWVHDPTYGNKDLEAESAINYQIGGEVTPITALTFEWNVFRSNVDDLINFNMDTMKFENIDKVVRRGVEGTATAMLPFDLTLSFSGSYVDVRNDSTDEIIDDIPRTLYVIRVTHKFKRLTHSLIGTCTDHNSSYPETRDERFVFNYRFNIDLPFKSGFGTPSFFGAAYNLGDSDYLYREVWPKPRRWVEAGLRFRY
ncbi:MAG: TonB-dependent receptor [Pseudomonadota bacterium]